MSFFLIEKTPTTENRKSFYGWISDYDLLDWGLTDESHPLRSFTLGVLNADNGGAGLSEVGAGLQELGSNRHI
jgi:hypothetical protein